MHFPSLMIVLHRRLFRLPTLGAAVIAYGCSHPDQPHNAASIPEADRAGWIEVFTGRDPDNDSAAVNIAADTVGSRRLDDGSYLVWIETRHAKPRSEGGRPFDRELLRFVLRCTGTEDSAYKRVSVTLLNGERPPVYQEARSLDAARAQAWDFTKPGTFDRPAFVRTCIAVARHPAP